MTVQDLHVTLVGIEQYGEGISRLGGPEEQVLAYARWAIDDVGVDPAEVFTFVSDPDGDSTSTTAALTDLGVPRTNVREAKLELIRAYCVEELPSRSPENLLWMWTGHGFLFRPTSKRILYCSNTSARDTKVLAVDDLLRYLRSTDIKHLNRQLLLFDVCAEGTDRTPAEMPMPLTGRTKRALGSDGFFQEAISAAAEEQFVQSGHFNRLALLALREQPAEAWPPPAIEPSIKRQGVPHAYGLRFGADSEHGDNVESVEIQRDLLNALRREDVIAIVGGHARSPHCRDEAEIATHIAKNEDVRYPFPDRHILSQVAEYVARREMNLNRPIDILIDEIYRDSDEPKLEAAQAARNRIRLLAKMPIKVYLTTAYDSLLERALELEGRRPIVMSYNERPAEQPSDRATVKRPIVFHLYGRATQDHTDDRSLAVTEFDIHQRNRRLANDGDTPFFPPSVRGELRRTHLYAGFDLRDRTLRGLLHALRDAQGGEPRVLGYAIQPAYGELLPDADEAEAKRFIDNYLEQIGPCLSVRVLWEFPTDIVDELTTEADHDHD